MDDETKDVARSSPEIQEGFRRILEERVVGVCVLPIHSSHADMTSVILAQKASMVAPLVLLGGHADHPRPNPFREMAEESRLYQNTLVYDLEMSRYNYSYELLDEDNGAPEWQKRRNRSAAAKQELIDKMKARRNAR